MKLGNSNLHRAGAAGALLAVVLGAVILVPAAAQTPGNQTQPTSKPADKPATGNPSVKKKVPTDPLRVCKKDDGSNRPNIPHEDPKIITPDRYMGQEENPQERYYREEITRLLKLEIRNVEKAIRDVESKHQQLVKLYPQFENYQEITLEDVPGAWRGGEFVNARRVLVMAYGADAKLDCMVLDSLTRNVYNGDQWTRKILRMKEYNVQTLEMETLRHNYRLFETMENAAPEVQLKAFRLIYGNLRTALYSMDMMIALYYDMRNRRNSYQIDL